MQELISKGMDLRIQLKYEVLDLLPQWARGFRSWLQAHVSQPGLISSTTQNYVW
jgi:hypothetical protein